MAVHSHGYQPSDMEYHMSDVQVQIAFATEAVNRAGSDLRNGWDVIGVSRPDRTTAGENGFTVGHWVISEEEAIEIQEDLIAAGVTCYRVLNLDDAIQTWQVDNSWELYTVS